MTAESQPQPERRGEVEGSAAWEQYSDAIDELEERVDRLIADYSAASSNDKESESWKELFQAREWEALTLQEDLRQDKMPVLLETIEAILKKIRSTINLKQQIH